MLSDDRILHRLAIVQVVLSSLILCVGVVVTIVASGIGPRLANLEEENRLTRVYVNDLWRRMSEAGVHSPPPPWAEESKDE